MGLFFNNYNKAGPGIDKNAPKKKGIFLYTELFFRKFWLLIKANLLYAIVSIPVLFIYNFIILNSIRNLLPSISGDVAFHLSMILTVLIGVLWGTGPVSMGYTYLLRNFAREEHVWLFSDFFEKIKENFKLGITILIADMIVLFLSSNAVNVYILLWKQGMGFAKYGLALLIGMLIIYTFMHFYVYQLGVTFENTVSKTIKNAMIMSVATAPMNIVLIVLVSVATLYLLEFVNVVMVIILALVCWMSLCRFPIDFCSARRIKRQFIKDEKDLESVE